MRQVPHYTIIGNGRIAKHFCHYFNLLHLPYRHWYRQSPTPLADTVAKASHLLILINDAQVDDFIEQNPCLAEKKRVHFSGCLVTSQAYGAHPLQTFSHELYTLDQYQLIPFIIEQEGPVFNEILPGLPNPHFVIAKQFKPYYHALCVMANNFTTILWQKLFQEFGNKLAIPPECALPLLKQTAANLMANYETALTGPLARNDSRTLANNLTALANDPFLTIFQAFVSAKQKENEI
jgi:hypothetical protein